MRIIVHTNKAEKLFKAINSKINANELRTWEIKTDDSGKTLYNHIPEQWSDTVLIYPVSHTNGLELKISWWEGNEPDEATKGYILGRFTEILMVHFRHLFEFLKITS